MNREVIRKKIILLMYWWQNSYKVGRCLKACEPCIGSITENLDAEIIKPPFVNFVVVVAGLKPTVRM